MTWGDELAIWLTILLLALCAIAAPSHAQTAILMPTPHLQFLDNNGKPLAGGFVFTFLAGTSTPQGTFTDSTGSVSNSNPIVLDAGGFVACSPPAPPGTCGLYFQAGISYRIVVQNSLGVQQWAADNVKLVSSNAPGGLNGQVQYNCAGSFCGNSGFTFNAGTQTLSVTALAVSSGGSLAGTFSGSPTLSGVWTFTAGVTATPFSSTCVPVASAGAIRLCRTDLINWRNAGNSADEGIGTDSTDAFTINHPNGVNILGTTPNVRFGGNTNAFPQLKRDGARLDVRLADDSNDANLVASQLGFGGAASPVLINGSCSTGQVLTATSANAVSCQPALAGVQLASITTNTGTAIGNSDTSWVTKSVVMPATGCPCRAFVSYSAMYTAGSSGGANFWVSDGTNNFAESQTLTNSASSVAQGITAASFSPVTYSNGANITFSGLGNTNAAGGLTIANPSVSNKQSPWLNVVIFTSN